MKLNKREIVDYLVTTDEKKVKELFELARKERNGIFGNKVFAYGFVYFTTYCKNNCNFCYFRKDNNIDRYRKNDDEVFALSKALVESGVHLIDLTMGEDQNYHSEKFHSVINLARKIKKELNVPVMISPGVVNNTVIDGFAEVGIDWYALYQETHNRELFSRLRIEQSYDVRMDAKLYAKEKGMLIEEGLLCGVGETAEDLADSIIEMGRIGAKQVRVMSFVPQAGSPMENVKTPDRELEYRVIALMRIMYPWALIPASLDVDGISGLQARIDAGANVITSIIPPKTGLAGVANSSKDVDEGGRTVAESRKILKEMGYEIATAAEYAAYLEELKCQA